MADRKFDFIKTDIHLHLDGATLPETLFKLGKERGVKLPADDFESFIPFVVADPGCRSVNEFLEKFELPTTILQDKPALTRVARELVERLDKQMLGYAEIRFAPQLHTRDKLSQTDALEAVIEGMESAERVNGIKTGLILCAMKWNNALINKAENLETVEIAKRYLNNGVNAVDLAGAERHCPLSDFAYVYDRAREMEIPYTCHAGDSDDSTSVKTAILEFGSKRIGHGHRIYDDKELCEIAAERGVTLEICLTSNVQCQTQPSYELHPAKKLLDMGICVTLNTDNPVISGVSIDDEYENALTKAGFIPADLKKMSRNAINAAFITDDEKRALLRIPTSPCADGGQTARCRADGKMEGKP